MITFLYACFEAWWRRCFGNDGWGLPVIKHRVVQHILGALACVGVCLYNEYHWIQAILCAGVLQGLYWARAVGMYQDIGNGGTPDEKMKKRYDEMWYNKFLDKWFKEYKYSDLYDFIGLTIRYSLPSILIAFILLNFSFLWAGFLVSSTYALMWKFHNYGYLKNPTEWAEWIAGFITGLMLAA
jgi:hypothetical protein